MMNDTTNDNLFVANFKRKTKNQYANLAFYIIMACCMVFLHMSTIRLMLIFVIIPTVLESLMLIYMSNIMRDGHKRSFSEKKYVMNHTMVFLGGLSASLFKFFICFGTYYIMSRLFGM